MSVDVRINLWRSKTGQTGVNRWRVARRALQSASLWAIWIALCCPPGSPSLAAPRERVAGSLLSPEHVVREFYEAISAGDCGRAGALNPDYPEARCKTMRAIQLHETALRFLGIWGDVKLAVVYLHVTSTIQEEKGHQPQAFTGHVTLSAPQGRWVIENSSYKRLSNLDFHAYLQWITSRFPTAALPAADAPAPPPAPRRAEAPSSVPTVPLRSSPEERPGAQDPGTAPGEPLPALPAPRSAEVPPGSQTVLALWSPPQLRGSSEERRVVRLPRPDPALPERTAPSQTLPPLEPRLRGSIRRVELAPHDNKVALTFDLCERADDVTGYDAPIVDYLREAGVAATFFTGGKWMRSHPERTKQLMADPLFELGNHSWSHANLRVLSRPRVAAQIQGAQTQYHLLWTELVQAARQAGLDDRAIAAMPSVPKIFRFPYGTCSREGLQAVAAAGLSAIQWDVVSGDPAPQQSVPKMVETVLRQTQAGSIVIFHANGRGHGTAEALPHIVKGLRAKGFKFVTVSALLQHGLQHGTVRPVEECYEVRPGDNRRYDKLGKEEARD